MATRLVVLPRWRVGLVVMCLMALAMPGCRGCVDSQTAQQRQAQKEKQEEERKKQEEEKEKKQPMAIGPLRPLPSQADRPVILIKPGHWAMVSQEMKRNYDDWVGAVDREVVDGRNQPIAIDRTRFALRSQRPVALSKGQKKLIDSTLFVPAVSQSLRIDSQLYGRDSAGFPLPPDVTQRMQPHQYHFVVLAANPASYGKLGSLRSVNAPLHFEVEVQTDPSMPPPKIQYRVVAPELGDRAPMPDSLFCLTSTAYVLWDEVDPEIFDPAQRAALVDWLHWGGQLLVSGPDSLATLRGSFLEPYLPAEGGDTWEITQQDLQPMVAAWGVGKNGPQLKLPRPWSGIHLKLIEPSVERVRSDTPVSRATAQLSCGGLLAERRVGRGRVIVSAMQLNQRGLQNWANGFECLMNGVVLRRPARRFRNDNYGVGGEVGQDDEFYDDTIAVEWAAGDKVSLDAGVNSRLRLLSRDTYADTAAAWRFRLATHQDDQPFQGVVAGPGGNFGQFGGDSATLAPPQNPGGVGGWDDFNQVSNAARETLREAAGVTVPGAGFVVGCVAIYLLVLAPFNWMFFRALGRVEFAWLAAPLIAIAGTVVVVKQAQLDIGFVRAQTEVALLETQPHYPRGCLTRFTGVYTSLATTYELTYDDPTAVAAPFASDAGFSLLRGEGLTRVIYDRQEKSRLRGLTVSSASTEMIHSEEMQDFGPTIRIGKSSSGLVQIENPTPWNLRHLAVVHRPVDKPPRPTEKKRRPATLMGCWIGDLPTKGSSALSWSPVTLADRQSAYAERRGEDAPQRGAETLNLEPLWRVALDPEQFEPGEFRAVARIEQSLPGLTIAPRAAQESGATLLVAHLQYEIPPAPERDANAPVDFIKEE